MSDGASPPAAFPADADGEARAAGATFRLIAFYLPQFHPIPENDAWWEPGFTEWTNVTRARPLYRGHAQPKLPADLGFYDLRMPEAREAQAAIAREYGIEAFCYWHYWFAGRRLLERPFDEVLRSGRPDLPFCLAWANESWTGIWHGAPDRVLVEQTYPGLADHEAHFGVVAEAFHDSRYVRVDGRPFFMVHRPLLLPDAPRWADLWQSLAIRSGLPGLYLVAKCTSVASAIPAGFDAAVISSFDTAMPRLLELRAERDRSRRWTAFGRRFASRFRPPEPAGPEVHSYADFVRHARFDRIVARHHYPCVMPNWDNTPRSGRHGSVLEGTTPELFRVHLGAALERVAARPTDERIVFVKAWNEWAEGNYLEPDQRFGRAYLEAVKDACSGEGAGTGQKATMSDER